VLRWIYFSFDRSFGKARGALARPCYEGDFFRFPKALTTMATTETKIELPDDGLGDRDHPSRPECRGDVTVPGGGERDEAEIEVIQLAVRPGLGEERALRDARHDIVEEGEVGADVQIGAQGAQNDFQVYPLFPRTPFRSFEESRRGPATSSHSM